MQRNRLDVSWLVLLLAAAIAGGCGSGRVVVISEASGLVTLDGTPLQDGMVSLESATTGYAACAPLDAEGRFTIKKVPVGTYGVTVTRPDPPPPGERLPPRPATMGPLRISPNKYWSVTSSGLTAEVPKEGSKSLAFELNSQ